MIRTATAVFLCYVSEQLLLILQCSTLTLAHLPGASKMIQWASKTPVKLALSGNQMFCSCPARNWNKKLFAEARDISYPQTEKRYIVWTRYNQKNTIVNHCSAWNYCILRGRHVYSHAQGMLVDFKILPSSTRPNICRAARARMLECHYEPIPIWIFAKKAKGRWKGRQKRKWRRQRR